MDGNPPLKYEAESRCSETLRLCRRVWYCLESTNRVSQLHEHPKTQEKILLPPVFWCAPLSRKNSQQLLTWTCDATRDASVVELPADLPHVFPSIFRLSKPFGLLHTRSVTRSCTRRELRRKTSHASVHVCNVSGRPAQRTRCDALTPLATRVI